MILCVSRGRLNIDEVFKPAAIKRIIIMYLFLGDNKCKCANEMCLLVFIKGFKQKSLIFLLLLSAVPILYLVCSFHNSDLIIAFTIDFEFLYLAQSNEY